MPRVQSEGGASHRPGFGIESPVIILVLLAVINFFNYVDRLIIGPLVPLLQKPVADGGLGLDLVQCGLLGFAFMFVHSVGSVPLGMLADRFPRAKLISCGVALWSLATAAAGLARSFAQIFMARASIGIGEATYAPAASAMISDRFKPGVRARALGVFQLGSVVGGAAGIVLGGIIGARFGWRSAFFVVGVPGLVLAAIMLFIREDTASRASSLDSHRGPTWSEAKVLMRSPGLIWINVTGILVTFFTGALLFLGPTFILEYYYDGNDKLLGVVSSSFGAIALPASIAGTIMGSYVGDRLERKRPGAGRLLAIAIGALATIPCAILGFNSSSREGLFLLLAIGVFFNVWYIGPVLAALHDVVPAHFRGTATGMYFFLIHLLGDGVSPTVVAWVAKTTGSLRVGLVGSTLVLALGGLGALAAIPGSRRVAELKARASAG
ncbi:MAG: MFS transporter [Deltaproteobacteria bacterium]|nr:MFS transporter [Deltaproteobacteria bacterium]